MRRTSQYRSSPLGFRNSSYLNDTYRSSSPRSSSANPYDLNKSYDETKFDSGGYFQSQRMSRRQSAYIPASMIPNISMYNGSEPRYSEEYMSSNNFADNEIDGPYSAIGGILTANCSECDEYRYLSKCISHCDLFLCESCQSKHWQVEITDLMNLKVELENNVDNLRKYLGNSYDDLLQVLSFNYQFNFSRVKKKAMQ